MAQQNSSDCKMTKVDKKNNSSCLQKNTSRGVILIEFAFCLPVLILLIYYIHDLNKLKRYYSQTEFAAQQLASMIQNYSENKTEKAILNTDLRRISQTVGLSIYQKRNQWDYRLDFGHAPYHRVIYVKGLDNGNASCIWAYERDMCFGGNSSYINITQNINKLPVNYSVNVAPSEIYPSLTINPGEVKIIIVFGFMRYPGYTLSSNGKYVTDKEAFNFYILNPKYIECRGERFYFFPSVVIFTPKPGLFSETRPL